jgi:hypothetical protein
MRKQLVQLLLLFVLTGCSPSSFRPEATLVVTAQPNATLTTIVITPRPSLTPIASLTRPAGSTETSTPPLQPTETATPTPPPTLQPSSTPTQTATPTATMPYTIQFGSPRYIASFAQPTPGCGWMGVAGQVFGPGMIPENGLVVFISGEINGSPVNASGVTGEATHYGEGGYEIKLADVPIESSGAVIAQVFDPSIKPLSNPISLIPSADCAKNLILLNFEPNIYGKTLFFPLAGR